MKLRRPTHATVVAYLALLVALGGSAYAVSKVRTSDLQRGAVTGVKVRNHSIGAKDLKRLVVRRASEQAAPDGSAELVARCKRRQALLGTASGWSLVSPSPNEPVISSSLLIGPRAVSVRGATPVLPNKLVAQAICLPK